MDSEMLIAKAGNSVGSRQILIGHKRTLEMLAMGESLKAVLDELVSGVEEATQEAMCSILLIDQENRLQTCSAPRLPADFSNAINGIAIGPNVGSCGTAAFRRETVIVSDIASDPLWRDFREMASRFDLHSCWSVPIISTAGRVMGTFAVYSSQIRSPSAIELSTLEDSTHIASVAIEHWQNREKLQEVNSLLHATIESTADGILVVNRDGKIASFNSTFAKQWNISKAGVELNSDELAQDYVQNQLKNSEEFRRRIRELYANPDIESQDVLEFKDGRVFERYSRPQSIAGRVVGRVWSFRDVTKRRQAEVAAEVAYQAKSRFLANISHEIRTPLASVLGFSELLMDEGQPPEDRALWIESLKRNGALLLSIVDEILNLAKAEYGSLAVELAEVDFKALLKGVVESFVIRGEAKGVTVNLEFVGEMPDTIVTDSIKLEQILNNIIGNALKFTEIGSILIKTEYKTQMINILVEDTGIGISADQTRFLFQPFSQLDHSNTRKFGGTGLGLALAKRLCNALGGDVILLRSRVGEGSCFQISLPIRASAHVDGNVINSQKTSVVEVKKSPVNLKGVKILVVDDSEDMEYLVKRFLSDADAVVMSANSGARGVELSLSYRFDIVLMDLQMPEMDGYEATRQLRERGYQGKIIALTAHANRAELEHILNSGFDDRITKPINSEIFVEKLVEIFQRNGERSH